MKVKLGKIKTTERGFQIINFEDRDGNSCSIQQSSLAEYVQPGSSAIWLGLDVNRMHLDIGLVEKLIPVLKRWLKNGEF